MANETLHVTSMDDYRYNSPHTSVIQFEAFGHLLQFSQDPNSKHLGTTVWDASMVLVKFLEKNCRKGQFHPSKLRGKRCIELGAGCGLAGVGMALLGCNVIATDQTEVLPLLMRNIERNTSRIKQSILENPNSATFGSVEVAELNWGNQEQMASLDTPFDYIIGTDIVYVEHLLKPLLETILSLAGPRTVIMIGYELRSDVVHEKMTELWNENFDVKRIAKSKMDSAYQHSSIELFIMRLKQNKHPIPTTSNSKNSFLCHESGDSSSNIKDLQLSPMLSEQGLISKDDRCKPEIDMLSKEDTCDDDDVCNEIPNQIEKCSSNLLKDVGVSNSVLKKCDNPWEVRRYGSMAARLLQNVRIPE